MTKVSPFAFPIAPRSFVLLPPAVLAEHEPFWCGQHPSQILAAVSQRDWSPAGECCLQDRERRERSWTAREGCSLLLGNCVPWDSPTELDLQYVLFVDHTFWLIEQIDLVFGVCLVKGIYDFFLIRFIEWVSYCWETEHGVGEYLTSVVRVRAWHF